MSVNLDEQQAAVEDRHKRCRRVTKEKYQVFLIQLHYVDQ